MILKKLINREPPQKILERAEIVLEDDAEVTSSLWPQMSFSLGIRVENVAYDHIRAAQARKQHPDLVHLALLTHI